MTLLSSVLGITALLHGAVAFVSLDSQGTQIQRVNKSPRRSSHHQTSPLSLELPWIPSDDFGGFYAINVAVGMPPQSQKMVFDTMYSDILLHSNTDPLYLEACKAATPVETCSTFDNTTSATFHGFGNGTFVHIQDDPEDTGEYFSDTLTLGNIHIKHQTMAVTNRSAFPVADFGTSPPNQQDGSRTGTFKQYPNFLESLVREGVYDSATYSVWLDPSMGPDNNPNTFPPGIVTFGGIDTSLYTGQFTTLPVVAINSTKVVSVPERWNLALSAMHLGSSSENLVKTPEGESCIISTGANVLGVLNSTLDALLKSFPEALFNSTTSNYQVSCSERNNPKNKLSLTFVDPRHTDKGLSDAELAKQGYSFTFTIPAAELIWPSDRLAPGGDPSTCALAVIPVEATGDPCFIGIAQLKSGYWVYDLTNGVISFATAAYKGEKEGRTIRLPKGGIKELFP
ncbi:acid protease [Rhizodiscina lignyota]|uniref:Acid protease n=1 Tax=Rhizodiscina lignyota TaxID=1504668 RepID=A0A9P4IN66_9PEZI|nr:acid protease [Rhizodiscina lignyota]